MNNKLRYSILYNFRKINYRILAIFMTIICIFTVYISNRFIELNKSILKRLTPWDLYNSIYIDMNIIIFILIFFSLYFTYICFNNIRNEYFMKIRMHSFLTLFDSKVISVFVFNVLITTITTIFILIIGSISLGVNFTWSTSIYSRFYSPIKIAFLNILIYSLVMTIFSQIIGVLYLKVKNKYIPGILAVIYIALDKTAFSFAINLISSLKYLSLNSYVNFMYRDLYNQNLNYITVRESIFIPIAFMIFTYLIISCLNKSKLLRND